MWQARYGYFYNPTNGRTYYPSYDAYFGFSGEQKEPSRDSRQNNHIRCENPDTPLIMPRPSSTGPMPAHGPGQPPTNPPSPQSQQPPQPITMYLVSPSQDTPKPEANETLMQSHMKPQPQFLPYPHPTIFPMPAPYPLHGQGLPIVPPQPFMGNQPPFAAAPPGTFPFQHPLLPMHQYQNQMSGGLANPSDLRYKCELCGNFRSPRYHRKHPIPPGQIPGKTICRRCREEATESEEESSSDNYRPHSHRRRHSRARSWNPFLVQTPRNRSRSRPRRARSSKGKKLIDNGYDSREDPPYSPNTISTGSDDARVSSIQARRYRRPDSPDLEMSKHFRKLKLVPQERVMYLEPQDRHQTSPHYYNKSVRQGSEHGQFPRIRPTSSPPVAEPRLMLPVHSNPNTMTMNPNLFHHDGPGHTHYGEAAPATYQPTFEPHRHRHRSSSRSLDRDVQLPNQHARAPWFQNEHYESDENFRDQGRDRSREGSRSTGRGRSRSKGRRGREAGRDQSVSHEFGHAPSPPPIPSLFMNPTPEAQGRVSEEHHRKTHVRKTKSRRRPRSKSRSLSEEELDLRPGDMVTVIERHHPQENEDYDWYDEGGMRVRVREI